MKRFLKIFVITIFALIITGCGSKELSKNASLDELFDTYKEGLKNVDVDKLISIYPDFTHEKLKKTVTKEAIEKTIDYYGDDMEVTIDVTGKEKMAEDELESFNYDIKQEYSNYVLASECYSVKGNISIKGSKKENSTSIKEMYYCNFDGTWRIMED